MHAGLLLDRPRCCALSPRKLRSENWMLFTRRHTRLYARTYARTHACTHARKHARTHANGVEYVVRSQTQDLACLHILTPRFIGDGVTRESILVWRQGFPSASRQLSPAELRRPGHRLYAVHTGVYIAVHIVVHVACFCTRGCTVHIDVLYCCTHPSVYCTRHAAVHVACTRGCTHRLYTRLYTLPVHAVSFTLTYDDD